MASAQHTEVFNCSTQEFFKIIADYEQYPQFLSEVKGMKVLKVDGARKLVEYTVNVIKSFKYQCWMSEVENKSINWEFVSGDIFKKMHGSWKLEDANGKTKATYSVDAEFGMFVPGPISKALVSVNLPNMMSAYHKRVEQQYGKRK